MLRACWHLGLGILAAMCSVTAPAQVVPGTMPSGSMQPTIRFQGQVQIDRAGYVVRLPSRFDIVVVKDPDTEAKEYIKRIIGMPGESLTIKGGSVYIDGKPLDEPFTKIPKVEDLGPFAIPNGEYFVLGDNRAGSYDSRMWKHATVTAQQITGRVVGASPVAPQQPLKEVQ